MEGTTRMQRRYWAVVLAYMAFLLPYTLGWSWSWWKFPAAAIAIIGLIGISNPYDYRRNLGLSFRPYLILAALLLYFLTNLCFDELAAPQLHQRGYEPSGNSDVFLWKTGVFFQAFNEEMLLRAFLLSWLSSIVRGFIASLCLSAAFALIHPLYYAAVSPDAAFNETAVLTLFLFSLGSNALFHATRSLLLPFAIHAGWNVNKFGEEWRYAQTQEPLDEATSFGLIEGNPVVLVVALISALLCQSLYFLHERGACKK